MGEIVRHRATFLDLFEKRLFAWLIQIGVDFDFHAQFLKAWTYFRVAAKKTGTSSITSTPSKNQ